MSHFDETLLSAYLDDELDPESRRRVEAAMQADPGLDRSLRDLARVRGLVAGLHRPTEAPDVSGAVRARVASAVSRRQSVLPFAAAAGLAAAAALVLVFLANRPLDPNPGVRPGGGLAQNTPEGGPEALPASDLVEPDPIVVEHAPDIPGPAPETIVVTDVPAPSAEEAARLAFALDLVEYDDGDQLEVEPAAGIEAAELVAELELLLRDTVRLDPRYGLIHPNTPGAAVVFALVASPPERQTLEQLVAESLGTRIARLGTAESPGLGASAGMLLARGDAMQLQTAPWVAPLRRGPHDPIHAIPRDPQDAPTSLGPAPLAPSLPGGLPGLPEPRGGFGPRPSSAVRPPLQAGPDDGGPGVVLLWVRSPSDASAP